MKLMQLRDAGGVRQTMSFALELKTTGDDGGIEGYGSVFGVKDSYADIVAKGAFVKSLQEHIANGTMPAMLWQHNSDQPIGIWTSMTEDSKGLKIKGMLALDTVKGKEAHSLLKMKALNGLSIGFYSKSWTYDVENEIRTLTEIDLWEVSLVTFPANGKATITQVKSGVEIAVPKDAERALRDAGFSKSDATAFVSRVMRLGEERREAGISTAQTLKTAERLTQLLKV